MARDRKVLIEVARSIDWDQQDASRFYIGEDAAEAVLVALGFPFEEGQCNEAVEKFCKEIESKQEHPMIYLIEKLWLDSMENSVTDAMGYEPVGYVTTEEAAKAAVEKAGMKEGAGWPRSKGEFQPVLRYKAMPLFTAESK